MALLLDPSAIGSVAAAIAVAQLAVTVHVIVLQVVQDVLDVRRRLLVIVQRDPTTQL